MTSVGPQPFPGKGSFLKGTTASYKNLDQLVLMLHPEGMQSRAQLKPACPATCGAAQNDSRDTRISNTRK
jgi:hypothetical protein